MESDKNFDLDEWYKNRYSQINVTAVPDSLPNRILHKFIEKPFKSNDNLRILEVGSNKGEHLPFVVKNFSNYLMTDIRPLIDPSLLDKIRGQSNGGIDFQVADVQNLPFEDRFFDRVISTCLFHHLDDPLGAFREVRRVTKVGGMISILIPNDPGILYRLLRRFTTLRNAKKMGLRHEAELVHAIEHRNHYLQLRTMLEHVYRNDKIVTTYFPLRIRNYNLNAITVLQIKKSSKPSFGKKNTI